MLSNGLKNAIAGQFGAIENQIDLSQSGPKGILQMKRSHNTIPADNVGSDSMALVDLRPSDQAEDIDVSLPPGMKFALQADIYTGPQGDGYILHLFAEEGGVRYHKAIDKGLEGRSHDWRPEENDPGLASLSKHEVKR